MYILVDEAITFEEVEVGGNTIVLVISPIVTKTGGRLMLVVSAKVFEVSPELIDISQKKILSVVTISIFVSSDIIEMTWFYILIEGVNVVVTVEPPPVRVVMTAEKERVVSDLIEEVGKVNTQGG